MLAVRARGMEIGFAIGAEIESRRNAGGTLRAGIGKGLADQQINDQAKNAVAGRENQHDDGPERGMHAATLGVAIDVAQDEEHAGKDNCAASDRGEKQNAGNLRLATEAIIGKYGVLRPHVVQIDADADDESKQPQRDAGENQPARNDAQFFSELGPFALAAKADQSESFVDCVGHDGFLFSPTTKIFWCWPG